MGDEEHEFGAHEPEGTPRGDGGVEGGGVPTAVAGVSQGTAEEEPRCGCGDGDGHEEDEEEPGPVVNRAAAAAAAADDGGFAIAGRTRRARVETVCSDVRSNQTGECIGEPNWVLLSPAVFFSFFPFFSFLIIFAKIKKKRTC